MKNEKVYEGGLNKSFILSALAVEPEVKKQNDECKVVFGECKKLEDQSISYIAKCKTSPNALVNTLGELKTSEDLIVKVDIKVQQMLNGTIRR